MNFQANAQNWKVKPEGLRDAIDSTKTYVVLPIENKTTKVLYEDALKYINKNYKNAKEVIKGNIENEYLKFVTYDPKFTELKVGWNVQPLTAVSRNGEKCAKFTLFFRKNFYLSGKYVVTKFATS